MTDPLSENNDRTYIEDWTYTYVRKVFHHPAKMAASSGEVPALDNLNNMIMVVNSVLSPYLMVRKYSSIPQL